MQIIIFLFKIIKIHKIKHTMYKIAYVAAVYNKINKKFQRLKIHSEMYSTNLIFDIVGVGEPEAEIGSIETIFFINYYETSYKLF